MKANKRGAPPIWNKAIEDKLIDLISNSDKGLRRLRKENPDLPSVQTIFKEIENNEDFAKRYARAKEIQAEFLADQIIEIADGSTNDEEVDLVTGLPRTNYENIQRSRLRVDARKWIASKLYPKIYGDKLESTVNQKSKITIEGATTEEIDELLGNE